MSAIPQTAQHVLQVTHFKSVKATVGESMPTTWPELVAFLTGPAEAIAKEAMPVWGGYASRNNARGGEHILQHYALVGDYDGKRVPGISLEDITARLEGVTALVHTTASWTPENPRFRIVVPLSKPVLPGTFSTQMSILNGLLGGILEPESWSEGGIFFYGRLRGRHFEFVQTDGVYVDELVDIEPLGKTEGQVRSAPQVSELRFPVTKDTINRLRAALSYIDADDRATWLRVGFSLSTLKGSEFAETGKLLWTTWSAKSKKHTAKDVELWDTLHAKRSALGTIFFLAKEAGWTDEAAQYTAEGIIEKLTAMKDPERYANWPDLVAHLTNEIQLVQVQLWLLKNLSPALGKGEITRLLKAAKVVHRRRLLSEVGAIRARNKHSIRLDEQQTYAQTLEVVQAVVDAWPYYEFVNFSGIATSVKEVLEPYSGTFTSLTQAELIPQVKLVALNRAGLRRLIEPVVDATAIDQWGGEVPRAVPDPIYDNILKAQEPLGRVVSGLINHPVVLAGGDIVSQDGVDEATRLCLYRAGIPDLRPYSVDESIAALARIKAQLFHQYPFATLLDLEIAVACFLTGIQRKVLLKAPGFAAVANTQSSGKSDLIEAVGYTLTGNPVFPMTWPDTEAEVAKTLLAMLRTSPEVLYIDNIADGFKLKSASLAMVLTASRFNQRNLGISEALSPSCQTLVCLTGNNLDFGADELTRILKITLQANSLRVSERKFDRPDRHRYLGSIRTAMLQDGVGIVAGYLTCPDSADSNSRYPDWTTTVAKPILRAGGLDVGVGFRRNTENNTHDEVIRTVLAYVGKEFPKGVFPGELTQLMLMKNAGINIAQQTTEDYNMYAALQELGGSDKVLNSKTTGAALRAIETRLVPWGAGHAARLVVLSTGANKKRYGLEVIKDE